MDHYVHYSGHYILYLVSQRHPVHPYWSLYLLRIYLSFLMLFSFQNTQTVLALFSWSTYATLAQTCIWTSTQFNKNNAYTTPRTPLSECHIIHWNSISFMLMPILWLSKVISNRIDIIYFGSCFAPRMNVVGNSKESKVMQVFRQLQTLWKIFCLYAKCKVVC